MLKLRILEAIINRLNQDDFGCMVNHYMKNHKVEYLESVIKTQKKDGKDIEVIKIRRKGAKVVKVA